MRVGEGALEGNVYNILEGRKKRLTACGKGLLEELALATFFSLDGRIEPPSEGLLRAMLALPRSDRTELAAILSEMAMRASRWPRKCQRGPRRA